MLFDDAVAKLKGHKDPEVRAAITVIAEAAKRRKKILGVVQEALQQLRVDMKYLVFDLECTRKERDEAKGGEG